MRYLIFIVSLFVALTSYSQKRWSAKDVIKLEDADIYFEITDYKTALDAYLPLYEEYGNAEDLEFKIGLCYYSLGQKEESIDYLEKAGKNGNSNAYFYLGLYQHQKENFEEAKQNFQIFKNKEGKKMFDSFEADRMIEIADRAKQMMDNPVRAMVYNLGDAVNSEYDDYAPLITADESMMALTSRREGTTGNKKDPYGEYLEDIYFASKVNDKWQKLSNAGSPLNSETHDAAVGLSGNGKSMIIYRTNKDLSAGDLYISHLEDNKWSKPEKMDDAINSEYQEASATLTDDERVIYFSSNRPGGFGGMDIYRIVRLGNNMWSLPLNLGPTINTAYNEDAPFIHNNGQTLYFSSKGHKTMGGYDIFKTSINEEYWSTPENLGYPANTVKDDIFFVLAADGKRGYYSTELTDGYGGHDIYAISFEDGLESLRIVKGKINNASGEALIANIDLLDEDGELYGTYTTNSLTGNYVVILPPNKTFQMIINSENYESVQDELQYLGGTNIKERVKNYTMKVELEQ